MKNLILALILMLSFSGYSQKFCYVDIEFILSSVPEYQQAQHELDLISKQWQTHLDGLTKELNDMREAYRIEKVLYTPQIRDEKLALITVKEKEISEYTQKKFGYKGELFKKRQDLVKPIQDSIYEAIEKLSKDKKYDFIFDKSAGMSILYAKSSYDKSETILKYLGY